jgi:23S rRNA pseudouridine1911/1915/1917 synthase
MWELVYKGSSKIRLDVYVHQHIDNISRAQVQKLIKEMYIQVNNEVKKPNYLLREGDVITGIIPEVEGEAKLAPWEHSLCIIHQDNDIIVLNKESNLVVHPGAGNMGNTLVNALLYHFPDISNVGNPLRPGIVHRLDKETSGLIVIARNQQAYLKLSEQFASRKVQKKYYALVWGTPDTLSGTISLPIGRDKYDRKKISHNTKKPRFALTKYTLIESSLYFSLLDIEIKTGRTHQIRVHLASLHLPIIGDKKYGGCNWNRIKSQTLRDSIKRMNIFGLQAYYLGFFHPCNGSWIDFSLPIDESFKEIMLLTK